MQLRGTMNERELRRARAEITKSAAAISKKADFSDLTTGHFAIAEPAERGVLLPQLQRFAAHVERRMEKEQWRSAHTGHPMAPPKDFKPKSLKHALAITMYDAAKMVILPATFLSMAVQCSLVELMATGPQLPRWFVSHWWGEPVVEFVASVSAHAKDRRLKDKGPEKKQTAIYWVSAFAANLWKLDVEDPPQSAFHQAIKACKGTVVVVDKDSKVFTRIWCVYEAHVALKSGHQIDMYTSAGPRKESEPDTIVACGITDGLAEVDKGGSSGDGSGDDGAGGDGGSGGGGKSDDAGSGGFKSLFGAAARAAAPMRLTNLASVVKAVRAKLEFGNATQNGRKKLREAKFPLSLAGSALGTTIEISAASIASDRIRILNSLVGSEPHAPPDVEHPAFAEINNALRGKFAAVIMRKLFSEADESAQRELIDAIAADTNVPALQLDASDCDSLTAGSAKKLAASIPVMLGSLELHIRPHGLAFATEWGAAHLTDARPNCAMTSIGPSGLNLKHNDLGDAGWGAIVQGVLASKVSKIASIDVSNEGLGPAGGKAVGEALVLCCSGNKSLTELNLRGNRLGDAGGAALAEGIMVNGSLTKLDVRESGIGDTGMGAIAGALLQSTASKLRFLSCDKFNLDEHTTALKFGGGGGKFSGGGGKKIGQATGRLLTALFHRHARAAGGAPAALPKALRSSSSILSECNVRGTDLKGETVEMLAKAAKKTEKRCMLFGTKHDQTEADFSTVSLTPADVVLLSSDVGMSKALTSLNLTSGGFDAAGIGPAGAATLAWALAVNQSLTKLDLSTNTIGGVDYISGTGHFVIDGIQALADALQVNTTLRSLDLYNNGIGPVRHMIEPCSLCRNHVS